MIMGRIIFALLGALVTCREILDGMLIANVCVDSRGKANREGFLCKFWKRLMIALIGSSWIMFWAGLVLEENGRVG